MRESEARREAITYQRSLEVYASADVIVAGGGPAGVAASLVAEGDMAARDVEIEALRARIPK